MHYHGYHIIQTETRMYQTRLDQSKVHHKKNNRCPNGHHITSVPFIHNQQNTLTHAVDSPSPLSSLCTPQICHLASSTKSLLNHNPDV